MRNKDGSTWDSAVQHLFHSPCHLFDTYIAGNTAYRAVSAPRWLNRIFLWVMGFFYILFYWFAACRMYYMLYSQVHTGLPSWTHPSSERNVCIETTRFNAVVQKVSRPALSLKGHPVHMLEDTHTHTHAKHKHVFTIIQVHHKQQGRGKYIIPGRREVLLRVHELTWAKTIAAARWINRFSV